MKNPIKARSNERLKRSPVSVSYYDKEQEPEREHEDDSDDVKDVCHKV
jgi:hypothetical protein